MSATNTKTYIANLACTKAGTRRITNFDTDLSEAAVLIRAIWDSVRRAELRTNAWKFAITRVQIVVDATAPDFGRAYRYAVPADLVRWLPLDPSYPDGPNDFLYEGEWILTDQTGPLPKRYVFDCTDTTIWDELFVQAFACRLAMEMIPELKQSSGDAGRSENQYLKFVADASRTNSIEQGPTAPEVDEWLYVRNCGTFGVGPGGSYG